MVLMGVLDQVQKYVEGMLGGLQHRRWKKTIEFNRLLRPIRGTAIHK